MIMVYYLYCIYDRSYRNWKRFNLTYDCWYKFEILSYFNNFMVQQRERKMNEFFRKVPFMNLPALCQNLLVVLFSAINIVLNVILIHSQSAMKSITYVVESRSQLTQHENILEHTAMFDGVLFIIIIQCCSAVCIYFLFVLFLGEILKYELILAGSKYLCIIILGTMQKFIMELAIGLFITITVMSIFFNLIRQDLTEHSRSKILHGIVTQFDYFDFLFRESYYSYMIYDETDSTYILTIIVLCFVVIPSRWLIISLINSRCMYVVQSAVKEVKYFDHPRLNPLDKRFTFNDFINISYGIFTGAYRNDCNLVDPLT